MKLFDIFKRLIYRIKADKNGFVLVKTKQPHMKINTGQVETELAGQVDAEIAGQVEAELTGQVKWKWVVNGSRKKVVKLNGFSNIWHIYKHHIFCH